MSDSHRGEAMSGASRPEPTCPGCGRPPEFGFATQAFCGNDDCHVFTWNPTKTLAENLESSSTIEPPSFLTPPTSKGDD